ncbi:MAG: short-chain fatty acid transporter [Deltaproteobacteria bacterium]|nr:short-chain fatty acid transporter [Deltaproteobacteria bacterium]MBW2444393.1 short-chain fatty acid transporter [Deltaproteobacteria bacterium]
MSLLDGIRSAGASLSGVTERWVPDSWVICMILTSIALLLAVLGAGVGLQEAILGWGSGTWNLLTLAMQFTIAMVAAHACVASAPVYRALDRVAAWPDAERPLQAVALAAAVSLVTAYLNWALCLVGCALFVPFLCKRNPKADVRVLIAGCYVGMGTVWHCGLSGSAPLILATPGNPLLAPAVGAPVVDALIPVTETLFSTFNLVYLVVMSVVGMATVLALHPRSGVVTLTPEQVEAILPEPPAAPVAPDTPAGRVDAFRGWVLLAVVLLAYPLVHSILTRGFGTSWTINAYNIVFLVVALLLHGRALSFLAACRRGLDATWGIIVQFPFYAGIFGLMTNTHLGAWLGDLFAQVATTQTFPLIVYVYSAVMNLFVPSAGSKWLIEAPFLVPAAQELGVSVKTLVLAYAYGDSTTNLIQPFFAIPILTVTRLRFGDVVGYTFLVAVACFVVSAVAMLLIPPAL